MCKITRLFSFTNHLFLVTYSANTYSNVLSFLRKEYGKNMIFTSCTYYTENKIIYNNLRCLIVLQLSSFFAAFFVLFGILWKCSPTCSHCTIFKSPSSIRQFRWYNTHNANGRRMESLSRKCVVGELLMTEIHVHIFLLALQTRMKIRFWRMECSVREILKRSVQNVRARCTIHVYI